jgi:hypothetical protein
MLVYRRVDGKFARENPWKFADVDDSNSGWLKTHQFCWPTQISEDPQMFLRFAEAKVVGRAAKAAWLNGSRSFSDGFLIVC